VLNARIAGSALSGAWWGKDDQAYGREEELLLLLLVVEEEERCGGKDDARLPLLLLPLLLPLALKNRLGMMSRSGWEARRMVERGEGVEAMEGGARLTELDSEDAYSETDGSGTPAAEEADVHVDLTELRDAVVVCGHGRGVPAGGVQRKDVGRPAGPEPPDRVRMTHGG
jgi:hypothetical protein